MKTKTENIFKANYKLKITAISCLILTLASILIAYYNPATGYELSIYESTPVFGWFFLIISIIGGISILIHQTYTKQYKCSNFWIMGLIILIMDRIILLYIPYIRGYFSWRGDNISHLGSVKDILFTGYFPSNNSYPITHTFIAEVVQISGLSISIVVNHSTAVFSAFYVISTYLLATSILPTRKAQILSLASILCVLFNGYDVYLMPNGWSLLYLPIVFFFYFKSLADKQILQYKLLFVITLVMFPFFHPLSSTMIILMLLVVGLTKYFIYTFEKKNISPNDFIFPLIPILIELTIFVPWLLSFRKFYPNIRNLYSSITTGGGSPDVIAGMGSTLDKINITGFELVELIIRMMGDEFIFLLLSFISFIILFKNPNKRKEHENLFTLLIITFFVGLMYAGYLFNIIPGIENFSSKRLTAYLVIFTPISAGFVFNYLIDKKINVIPKNAAPIICIVIIMTASVISIFSLYPSPYVTRPNLEITNMDMHGVQWHANSKNLDIKNVNIMTRTVRFVDGAIGSTNSRNRFSNREQNIPDHFNYTVYEHLGNSFDNDKYSVITKYDTVIYDTVWKVVGRFSHEDFEMVKNDSTVDMLYDNGETYVWYIHSI